MIIKRVGCHRRISPMSHKFPIRKIMSVLGAFPIVHLANIILIIPTNMHTFPCFRWCRIRYDVIYPLQANILDCRLQHKSTLVAIGFFSLVILYECCVATLGASPNCFCSNQCIPSPYIFNTDNWMLKSLWDILWPWNYILKLVRQYDVNTITYRF